jgi:tripartite-type tricarboxylate transporter receptor subunit TctC
MKISKIVLACVLVLSLAVGAAAQQSSNYPAQPVKVIVPYPAGNSADLVGRVVAEKLSQIWGQPVNVENRPGPGTVPGANEVAKSKPDGYTLLSFGIAYVFEPLVLTNLPYDPEKDLVAVAPYAKQPFALAASPSLGVKSVADLVAVAKAKPGLKFGSLGSTTPVYFVAEQFKKQTQIDMAHVSYKSTIDANEATAKGEVAFWFSPVAVALAGAKEGKVTPLAVTADKRSAMLPQVPTMAEAGVKNMEKAAWFGMWAPAGTPAGIIEKIAKDISSVLESPEVREKLSKMGAEPMSMTPSQFAAFVRGETEANRLFLNELGVKPQPYVAPKKE